MFLFSFLEPVQSSGSQQHSLFLTLVGRQRFGPVFIIPGVLHPSAVSTATETATLIPVKHSAALAKAYRDFRHMLEVIL